MKQEAPASSSDLVWLHRFAVLTAACTFPLIFIGGLVTSKDAGLAVPDWPNTYGYNMFLFPPSKWVGNIFYEHGHRLFASIVGLATTILALWLYGKKSRPVLYWAGLFLVLAGIVMAFCFPQQLKNAIFLSVVGTVSFVTSFFWPRSEPLELWPRRIGLVAFLAVVFQGVLGGLRVVLLKSELGIFHACLAQAFFCLVVAIAIFTSRWWKQTLPQSSPFANGLRAFCLATTIVVFCQLALGATMRHTQSGLAIPDFPLAYGQWLPPSMEQVNGYRAAAQLDPVTAGQVAIHFSHRIGALVVSACVLALAALIFSRCRSHQGLFRLAVALVALLGLQIFLGAWTVLSGKAADVATAHVAVGALILAVSFSSTLLSYKLFAPSPATQHSALSTQHSVLQPS